MTASFKGKNLVTWVQSKSLLSFVSLSVLIQELTKSLLKVCFRFIYLHFNKSRAPLRTDFVWSCTLPPFCELRILAITMRIKILGTIHSTKIPTGKSGPPQKVDPFFRNFSGWTEPIHWVLDLNFQKFWLNGSRPLFLRLEANKSPCLLHNTWATS